MKILVTGAAGFIGAAVSQKLLDRGDTVVGFDNMNDYYSVELKEATGKKADMELFPLQPGDIPDTNADVEALKTDVGYQPTTPVEVGVKNFVEWYCKYYCLEDAVQ
jgi:nucleoside-diphosphate-sugar epimerase